jgi:energy-coupling factor transporter transmembrane protein EcfT
LVIFDEPTQSLDDASWVAFVQLVREVADSGVAVVIVTHDRQIIVAVHAREYVVSDAPAPPAPATADSRAAWLRDANPLALIAASGAVAAGLIVTLDVVSAAVAVVLISLLSLTTGLAVGKVARRLVPICLAAVFSAITIALYGQESGAEYVSWGLIVVSEGSVELAVATFFRILAIATPAVVLFTGVDATRLADGLAQLWRLPERFVIGALSGIRLVQLLGGDMATLRNTRASRGIGDAPWWRRVFSEVFTLLVVALRRADTLALAMDARGFARSTHRTHYRLASWHRRDSMIVLVGIIIAAVSVGAAVWTGEFNAILG